MFGADLPPSGALKTARVANSMRLRLVVMNLIDSFEDSQRGAHERPTPL